LTQPNFKKSRSDWVTLGAAAAPSGADLFESNDSRAAATVLGLLTGTRSWNNLSIHSSTDQDWFRFNLGTTGTSASYVRIDFQNTLGDLDMILYDAAGNVIARSDSTNDYEQISLQGLAAGTYYLEVFGYNGATNSNYALSFNTP